MNVLALVIALITIFVVGGGGFLWLWLKMQPKKIFWHAMCYTVGEGVKKIEKDKTGNPIQPFKLKDLLPYHQDVLVKEEKAHGITLFRLKGLNLTTNPVTGDVVELWKDKKIVNVLIEKEQATLLRKGYDEESGQSIFKPMPRERIEMLSNQIVVKRERYQSNKDTLSKITPFIVAGIWIIGLVAGTYFLANGWINASETNAEGTKALAKATVKASENYREALNSLSYADLNKETENNKYGKQPSNEDEPPPSIE